MIKAITSLILHPWLNAALLLVKIGTLFDRAGVAIAYWVTKPDGKTK